MRLTLLATAMLLLVLATIADVQNADLLDVFAHGGGGVKRPPIVTQQVIFCLSKYIAYEKSVAKLMRQFLEKKC
jgi:hypothetical protein